MQVHSANSNQLEQTGGTDFNTGELDITLCIYVKHWYNQMDNDNCNLVKTVVLCKNLLGVQTQVTDGNGYGDFYYGAAFTVFAIMSAN